MLTAKQRAALTAQRKVARQEIRKTVRAAKAAADAMSRFILSDQETHENALPRIQEHAAGRTMAYSQTCMYEQYMVTYYETKVAQSEATLAADRALLAGARLNLQACQGGVIT